MSLRGFVKALGRGRRCLLLLDYDGTCAPIRRDRRRARLSRPWRAALTALAQAPGVRLAFISGRSLGDLRRLAPIPGAAWIGSHGLEWWRPSMGPDPASRRAWRARSRRAQRDLAVLKGRYPRLDVEAKGPDLSLHLRGLSSAQRARLRSELAPLLRDHRLALHCGRSVFELRPLGGWHKGDVVRRLRRAWGMRAPCLYAGDDRTDEDAFQALGRLAAGATFKVGRGRTRAGTQGSRQELLELLRAVLKLSRTKE